MDSSNNRPMAVRQQYTRLLKICAEGDLEKLQQFFTTVTDTTLLDRQRTDFDSPLRRLFGVGAVDCLKWLGASLAVDFSTCASLQHAIRAATQRQQSATLLWAVADPKIRPCMSFDLISATLKVVLPPSVILEALISEAMKRIPARSSEAFQQLHCNVLSKSILQDRPDALHVIKETLGVEPLYAKFGATHLSSALQMNLGATCRWLLNEIELLSKIPDAQRRRLESDEKLRPMLKQYATRPMDVLIQNFKEVFETRNRELEAAQRQLQQEEMEYTRLLQTPGCRQAVDAGLIRNLEDLRRFAQTLDKHESASRMTRL